MRRAPISRSSKGDKHRHFCQNAGFVIPGRSSTKYLSPRATSARDRITRMHFSRAIEKANTSPERNLLNFRWIETNSCQVWESFNTDKEIMETLLCARLRKILSLHDYDIFTGYCYHDINDIKERESLLPILFYFADRLFLYVIVSNKIYTFLVHIPNSKATEMPRENSVEIAIVEKMTRVIENRNDAASAERRGEFRPALSSRHIRGYRSFRRNGRSVRYEFANCRRG